MSVACPCCRAVNESGPLCRRCKADLGLMFALENQRLHCVEDSKRRAVAAALNGDFANALSNYRRVPGETGHTV